MPSRGHGHRMRDTLTNEGQRRLTKNAYCSTCEARSDREADHPRLAPPPHIRYRAEHRYRHDHQNGSNSICHGVHEIRRSEIAHYPYGEVERRDIHRENRVREVVKGPAPTLDCWCPNHRSYLAAGFESRHYVLWVRHWALLPHS